MVTPLVFRHGAAEVAFSVLLLTWALGAEYERFAAGRKRLVPGVW